MFMDVAEKLGVPVITGWDSEDIMYDTHPLYVGRAGNMGTGLGILPFKTATWCSPLEAV